MGSGYSVALWRWSSAGCETVCFIMFLAADDAAATAAAAICDPAVGN